jgi:hypothetical protein
MALTIIDTIADAKLFRPWFAGASWDGWRVILKAAYALLLSAEEQAFFRSVAGREPPDRPAREVWIIAGRRAGKDSVASVIAAQSAAFFDPSGRLRGGERACVLCLAVDREQARIVLGYTKSYFAGIPYLKAMVLRETKDGLELDNGVDVVVATNSYRSVRGRSIICTIFDEVAFWRSENSAAPDIETYHAIMPGLATLPGSMLIGISSPHKKSGLLYDKWREHYGHDGDVLVIRAPSILLNPTLDQRIIDDAMVRDPAVARAEWMAEWRDDLAQFLDRQLVEAAVDIGVAVRPPVPSVKYFGFADPSGGAGDSFTLSIAHSEKNDQGVMATLDCLIERRAPFNPDAVTAEMAQTLKSYGLNSCTGDRYAAQWVVQSFAKHGITYQHSLRDRSAIYGEVLPLFTSGRARLLDNRRLVAQFASLERRTSAAGRDRIDHPPNMHDDLSNSAAGALVAAADQTSKAKLCGPIIMYSPAPGSQFDAPAIGGGYGYSDYAISELNRLAGGRKPW